MYQIGDRIVYPMHGAGVVESIEDREFLGENQRFLVVSLPLKHMKVMLPERNVVTLGVRGVIEPHKVCDVLTVLGEETDEMNQNWNRRYRDNMDKIRSGDIFEVAQVVRNLTHMDQIKGLSTGERKMLSDSRQILVSELILAQDATESDVERLIQGALVT